MLEKADLILTMTQGHKDAILSVRPAIWTKIHTLNEYVGLEEKDISDPYGGSEATYRESLASIERALVKLIDIIAG
jgi:protein-tyrosine-phosphatase